LKRPQIAIAMDYDTLDIAPAYDKGRALTPEALRQWREFLATHIDRNTISLIVDLGCGTGRFSELLAVHFGAKVVGIEPSQKMLDQARSKLTRDSVLFQRAAAEALPLADGCADLVFMSMVYHHLVNSSFAARECRRVLRHGGYVCIRNGTREADFPQRHFFPAIQPLIDTQLPSRGEIVATFAAVGFALAVHETLLQVAAVDWHGFVEKCATRADSFLARISDRDFRSGMNALRAHVTEIDADAPVTEEIDWFLFVKQA
jgi:ubiquinone/menaquinone biosynthesis C-methylase UbiE